MAVIPALVITAISGYAHISQSRAQTLGEAYRMTQMLSNYQSNLIQDTRRLLQVLVTENEIRSARDCPSFLERINRSFTIYASLSVADVDGRITCSSASSKSQASISDREYFQKAIKQNQIITGVPVTGRLTGKVVQPIAVPIHNSADQVTGVLVATLDLQQVIDFSRSLDIPPQSAILLVDPAGTVIMRYPQTEAWAGQRLPDAPIIKEILSHQKEGSAEAAGLDGIKRLYAFTPIGDRPETRLYISIGIPSSVAYAQPNRILVTNLALIGLTALLALATAWFGGDILFLRVVSLTAERDLAEKELKLANAQLETRVEERTQELARAVEQLNIELAERRHMVDILHRRGEEMSDLMQRLQQSNADLQDFAFIASHDLQEPLRKIQAFGERLLKQQSSRLDSNGVYYAERMSSSANRLQAMINALLNYSRINTQGRTFISTDLNLVIDQVRVDLDLIIRETGGKLCVDPLPTIEADPLQMYQMLLNLVSNGLKFHRPGTPPEVRVSANPQDDHFIDLVVEDNGIGFDEKYLDRIFQPFQRLNSREQFEGSGIGLAVCRKIAERHHGHISAKSMTGSGSRFIVTLPFKQTTQHEKERGADEEV